MKVKEGGIPGEEAEAMGKKLEAGLITPAEKAQWERGASNAGYHYLGCAKTFALMGRECPKVCVRAVFWLWGGVLFFSSSAC